jgi:recombination protein RecT
MGNGLADRVSARAQVARRDGGEVQQATPTLRKQIEDMVPQFELAMPRGFEAKQLMRDAMTLLRQNPQLAECVTETVLGGLMTFAQLGLRPGVMGQGWLLPFKNWKKGNRLEAQIVIGYQGYLELVHRSGAVKKTVGRAVHRNDEFDVQFGLHEDLRHRPAPFGKDRGDVVAYYSTLWFEGADPLFWVMTREEAIEWRDHHAMGTKRNRGQVVRDDAGNAQGAGPWFDMEGPAGGTGFDQMAIKTCFLRAKRWAPKSTDRLLNVASEVDGAVRIGFSDPTDPDDMLDAEHPEPPRGDVIDVEAEETPARDQVTVTRQQAPREDDVPPPPEPQGAAPAAGGDNPATDPQGRAIAAIIRAGLGKTPGAPDRRTILGALIGRTVESQKDLTFSEAHRAIDQLNAWQKDGSLGERLAAMLGTATGTAQTPAADAPAEPAGELPTPGTRAWHDAGHPARSDDGRVTTVPALMNGECGICEEPESDPRDEEGFEG